MTESLHLTFEVNCTPDVAFQTWTSRASTWWPSEHSFSNERGIHVVFEGRVGGRIFERTSSGVEHEWGRMTVWEPPTRLAYTWHLRFSPDEATNVEIRFVDIERGRTRVEIEHGGWDRLGDLAPDRREGNRLGWMSVFPYYAEAIEKGAV